MWQHVRAGKQDVFICCNQFYIKGLLQGVWMNLQNKWKTGTGVYVQTENNKATRDLGSPKESQYRQMDEQLDHLNSFLHTAIQSPLVVTGLSRAVALYLNGQEKSFRSKPDQLWANKLVKGVELMAARTWKPCASLVVSYKRYDALLCVKVHYTRVARRTELYTFCMRQKPSFIFIQLLCWSNNPQPHFMLLHWGAAGLL